MFFKERHRISVAWRIRDNSDDSFLEWSVFLVCFLARRGSYKISRLKSRDKLVINTRLEMNLREGRNET